MEASLIENIARLDPDEVTRWESFTRLVKEGRTPEDISLTFGLTALQVKRTLALGNLLPRIRNLYRDGSIDVATVRHLTLAPKTRQRQWLALLHDEGSYCPTGYPLKSWLFGGASIPVTAALFDLDAYSGEIVADLFGDERYFGSASDFWTAQMAAVDDRAEAYAQAGWPDVVVMAAGDAFQTWEYERTPKKKGGRVYIAISQRGDVTFHEGYVTLKEARKLASGESLKKPMRPEISAPIQNYLDLHRHAAVRTALADRPSLALRVMAAHAIVGSSLWNVRIEPQRAHNEAIAESIETCVSETAFDQKRLAVIALLGFDPETPTITRGYEGEHGLAGLLIKLVGISDAAVMEILAVVMAETLESASPAIEALGVLLEVDMTKLWQADDALLDLIKDRELLGEILTDVAGKTVSDANANATGKVKRGIVRDCLTGSNGREKVENWVPRWMAFPPSSYTERGGIVAVDRAKSIAGLLTPVEPIREAA